MLSFFLVGCGRDERRHNNGAGNRKALYYCQLPEGFVPNANYSRQMPFTCPQLGMNILGTKALLRHFLAMKHSTSSAGVWFAFVQVEAASAPIALNLVTEVAGRKLEH